MLKDLKYFSKFFNMEHPENVDPLKTEKDQKCAGASSYSNIFEHQQVTLLREPNSVNTLMYASNINPTGCKTLNSSLKYRKSSEITLDVSQKFLNKHFNEVKELIAQGDLEQFKCNDSIDYISLSLYGHLKLRPTADEVTNENSSCGQNDGKSDISGMNLVSLQETERMYTCHLCSKR